MTDNPNEITVDNSVVILIDHQLAGATPINWVGVACGWAPDFTSDERHKVNPAVMKNGAGVGLALEQAFAQS